MAAVPQLLSFSRVNEWLHCRYRWQARYQRKLSVRVDHRAPQLGTAVHRGLAAVIKHYTKNGVPADFDGSEMTYESLYGWIIVEAGDEWFKEYVTREGRDLFDEELAALGDIQATAYDITLRTLDHIDLHRWETSMYKGEPLIEAQVIIPLRPYSDRLSMLRKRLPGWLGYQAYFDWVAVDKNTGMRWLIDWKTKKSFTPAESEEISLQQMSYEYVLYDMGLPVTGSSILQIKSAMPKTPELNKNGTMARDKIATTWAVYRAELLKHGLNPDDYEANMRPKLDEIEWFRWVREHRSFEQVRAAWDEIIIPVAREIGRRNHQTYPRAFGFFNCMGCWARDLCMGELRNDDVESIIHTSYIVDVPEEEAVFGTQDLSG